jgi:hypothetical protein
MFARVWLPMVAKYGMNAKVGRVTLVMGEV